MMKTGTFREAFSKLFSETCNLQIISHSQYPLTWISDTIIRVDLTKLSAQALGTITSVIIMTTDAGCTVLTLRHQVTTVLHLLVAGIPQVAHGTVAGKVVVLLVVVAPGPVLTGLRVAVTLGVLTSVS